MIHRVWRASGAACFLIVVFLLGMTHPVFAGSLTFTWRPNTEPDLSGYRVYYGTKSRVYGPSIPVGKVNSYTIKGLAGGTHYYLALTAVDTSGNESGYSAEVSARASSSVPPATGVRLSASSANPAPASVSVRFTAVGAGGSGSYEYRFWLRGPSTGNSWKMVRNYSAVNTWNWTKPSQVGVYAISVHVRSVGSEMPYDARDTINYAISAGGPTLTLEGSPENKVPFSPGTIVTFAAAGDGFSSQYEYRFWLRGPSTNGAWKCLREYSTSSTWAWRVPAEIGTYAVSVHARKVGSTAYYERKDTLFYRVSVRVGNKAP